MAFLTPLFLAAIAALGVPVLLHMIQRQRTEVIEFPSLMFVKRIPFHSLRRQRIRHWLLLLLRCAALLLLIAAFARPFFQSTTLAAVAGGAREVVVLLDRSYSMAYGDRWDRARAAARGVVRDLSPADQATVILFDSGAVAGRRSTTDQASLLAAIDGSAIGAGTTRFGPPLQLAQGILEDSDQPLLEVVLISDFQQVGVDSAANVRFPAGTVVTPVQVASEEATPNISVVGASVQRDMFASRERATVTARLANRGNETVEGLRVALELNAYELESLPVTIEANSAATVTFAPFTVEDTAMPVSVRASVDALPHDDVFHFTVLPGDVVSVLVIGGPGTPSTPVAPLDPEPSDTSEPSAQSPETDIPLPDTMPPATPAAETVAVTRPMTPSDTTDTSLYLRRALGVGTSPLFSPIVRPVGEVTLDDIAVATVIVLNDVGLPSGAIGEAITRFVEDGGGLWVALGEDVRWPGDKVDLLPGTMDIPADRDGRGGVLGFVDYSHPIFEVFGSPRSGDLTTPRFFRHRPLALHPESAVLARFDNGDPAMAERTVGAGRVLVWTTTIDSFWNDFALKSIYLPFVHKVIEYLAEYRSPTPYLTAGQVLDLAQYPAAAGLDLTGGNLVVRDPSDDRVDVRLGTEETEAAFVDLAEQGFYELRDTEAAQGELVMVAVNVDLAESNLSSADPQELVGLVTGRAAGDRSVATEREIRPEELERRQTLWWYLLIGALGFLATETVMSNRLSRTEIDPDA
ncbi:MAG: BatA domain-containing protein [Acidobacteriota bacterium]|nr:BatA domain-containing protein [Acidobacteriota bacterium]